MENIFSGQLRRWKKKYYNDASPMLIVGFEEEYVENGDGVNGPKLQQIVRIMQDGVFENFEIEIIRLHTEEMS